MVVTAVARDPVRWGFVMAASWAEAKKVVVETARVGPLAVEARVVAGWAAMQVAARAAVAAVAVATAAMRDPVR